MKQLELYTRSSGEWVAHLMDEIYEGGNETARLFNEWYFTTQKNESEWIAAILRGGDARTNAIIDVHLKVSDWCDREARMRTLG